MFHRLLCIWMLAVSLPAYPQVLDTVYFDKNWEQTGLENAYYYRIVSIDSSGDFRLYVEDYYPGGQIQMTGTYKSIQPMTRTGVSFTGTRTVKCRWTVITAITCCTVP